MKVYLLQHEYECDGADEIKLVGVYASEREAEEARRRSGRLPGFKDHPDGFSISPYEVGRDLWTDGFLTLPPRSKVAADADKAA